MIRSKQGNPVNLMPGDELSVVTDRPMLVSIVSEIDESIAQVEITKEWGDLAQLRTEVQRLRGHIKQLNWQLEKIGADA